MHVDKSETEMIRIHSYDEALSMTGIGKYHYFLLLTCGLCLMAVIVETLNIGFIIPLIDLECHFKLTLIEKGVLNSAAFAGVILSSYLWGYLADRSGRKKVMLISSAITFIFSFLSSFSISVWMLIVTRFFTGFFICGISANSYAYIGEFFCESVRAKYMNLCSVFMAFALTLSPGLGWISLKIDANSFGNFAIWRVFLLTCSLISLIIAISLHFLTESPKFLLANQRDDEALRVLKKIHKWNKGGRGVFDVTKIDFNETLLNSSGEKSCWVKSAPLYKAPLLKNTLKISFLMFSFFANSSGFYMWTPDILNQILDYPNLTVCEVTDLVIVSRQNRTVVSTCDGSHVNDKIYEITFMMGCFFSLIYFINAFIINTIGKKQLLSLWFVLCGIASFLLIFFRDYYVILFLLLIFLTSGVCGAIVSSIIVDIYPTNVRAMGLCFLYMVGRLGAIFGANFVSIIIINSCTLMFVTFGLFLLISAFITLTLRN